jgi:serine/threonine-protein kinase RsbT
VPPPRATPTAASGLDLELELLEILSDYVSRINARSLIARAVARSGRGNTLDAGSLRAVLARIETGLSLFAEPKKRDELGQRLRTFEERHAGASVEAETIPVSEESDIVVARTKARILCDALGARSVTAHKVATVVSELARNIVSYTDGGSIGFEPDPSGRAITLLAVDTGPGIPNVEEILSGRYRSRTGLGLGLAGSKRLAERFDIQTGASGTTITVRIAL